MVRKGAKFMNTFDKLSARYTPVIGLEVHVELNTKSKMFCECDNNWFGAKPNTHTCPVCLGLPGALPVPNKKAIEGCIKIGMALGCDIPLISKFDRKNYFYPDLAKGYQISQYDQPFSEHGSITLSSGKKIGITRAHMEEDTGKLMHETVNGQHVSLIDFNRSGSPLVEIVTEPDFESAEEVKEYLQKLRAIVRYLGVADGDMEKGGMRLEPNISLRAEDQKELPNYKVEVKNINSFNFVVDAIEYEIKRHTEALEKGETPKQETRGWDEDQHRTISQRSKEEAADYRYFPEPDIPPFVWTKEYLDGLRKELPELPDAKKGRFVEQYGLTNYNADLLTRTDAMSRYFEEVVKIGKEQLVDAKTIANTIINKKIDTETVLPAELVKSIVALSQVSGVSDEELQTVLKTVLTHNEKSVADYKAGKTNAIMFLVGQAMRELKGKAKADTVRTELEKLLS
ncbi:MAG TPA: Asp-tRNA(Asn)/Glu-tRNA(Gln) amidotransferase subunit GatB [Patescibacteria group bacterium]|nr:Asp-tRNA(Asn)/Glu-tRNA(Gln) amidotransferase subunit GatB [Patescibacteria group bacterium]